MSEQSLMPENQQEEVPSSPPPGSSATATSEAPVDGAVSLEASESGWQPNFKYKFEDQEREIDPLFRSLVKDAETEKKVREVFQLADAFPKYKERLGTAEKRIKEEYEPVMQKFSQLDAQLKGIGELYRKGVGTGELEDFFEALKINDQALFKYVARKLQFQDLPEETKRLYDEKRQYQNRASQLESEVVASRERAQSEMVQARAFQLDQSLSQGEIKQAADAVDALVAPGAFRQRVIEVGRLAALDSANPRDLTVDEAVKIALMGFQPFLKGQGSTAMSANGAVRPAVIKNVNGTAATPAKRVIKSLADIEARRKELSQDE